MDDRKEKAKAQIVKLWDLADEVEMKGLLQDIADKLFGVIYSSAEEIAEANGFIVADLERFEEERRYAGMHWEDKLQMEFEERVANGEHPHDISFG